MPKHPVGNRQNRSAMRCESTWTTSSLAPGLDGESRHHVSRPIPLERADDASAVVDVDGAVHVPRVVVAALLVHDHVPVRIVHVARLVEEDVMFPVVARVPIQVGGSVVAHYISSGGVAPNGDVITDHDCHRSGYCTFLWDTSFMLTRGIDERLLT